MATTTSNYPTMLDVAKTLDPKGRQARIVELLETRTPFLKVLPWIEANDITGHRVTASTSLPSFSRRRGNKGIVPDRGTDRQFVEVVGMLEGRSAVDDRVARRHPNPMAFRKSRDDKFLIAARHTVEDALIYDNAKTDEDQILGLAPRYNDLSGTNVRNIITGDGGTGDNTSIWMMVLSPESVYGVYPQGATEVIRKDDLGKQLHAPDSSNPTHELLAWITNFEIDLGLVVEDWRQAARICNIDTSELEVVPATGDVRLVEAMVKAYHTLEDPGAGNLVIMANRLMLTYFHLQALYQTNVRFTLGEWYGMKVTEFMGAPILLNDRITNAEAAVS